MKSETKKSINKWFLYPDSFGTTTKKGNFYGFNTADDVTQMPGFFPIGQNIKFTDAMTPAVRDGYNVVGTENSDTTPVKRAWRFEKNDGTEIEMKAYDDGIDFLIDGVMTDYDLLQSGFTPNLEFCYAVISNKTDICSYVFYCNGVDNWYKWSGSYAHYLSDNGADQITVQETTSLYADSQFTLTGTITINGVDITYTGILSKTGTFSFVTTPANTKTIVINGVTFTFVNTLTGVAGQILINGQTGSIANFVDLLNHPGTTDSNHVALSAPNQLTIANISNVQNGLTVALSTINLGNLVVTTTITDAFYTYVYSDTFTGCSSVPAGAVAGDLIIQTPIKAIDKLAAPSLISSVGIAHDDRIHARSDRKKSVTNYSRLGDPDTWTITTGDGNAGAKELEQGGPITAYAHDEKALYIFKRRLTKILQFVASGTRVDVDVWGTLKSTDDKSTTVGAINQKSTFSSPNGILFVTEDKELLHLTRGVNLDYPTKISISQNIQPTFDKGVHEDASGIVWQNKVWYSYKQDENSQYNDTVLVYDLITNIWWEPIVGWNVSDWTIIGNKLRWHSSINSNSYEIDDTSVADNTTPFTTILRTWSNDFGMPQLGKTIGAVYVEILMNEIAQVNLSVLYDENGKSGVEPFVLQGSDVSNLMETVAYNPFGVNSFGLEVFGSNAEQNNLKRYKYIIPLKGNIDVYTMSMQFSTVVEGTNYELIRVGYFFESYFEQANKNIIKSI